MEHIKENLTEKYALEKQSSISVKLIVGIVIMTIFSMNISYHTEDEKLFQLPVISGTLTLLLGGYVFVYRGRGFLASKIFFVISLIITVLLIGGLLYLSALAQAFQH